MPASLRNSIVAVLAVIALASAARGDEPKVNFDRQVRPILADKCFACHGPDAEAREAGLRLDVRDQALAPADSGKPAIVPGDAAASPLVKRITSSRSTFQMPPPDSNKTLSADEKDILARWVEQGAEYQTHWAFLPPKQTQIPKVDRADWAKNPIDAFLYKKMREAGLSPSPEADRATLIRRVTLDLTGLPPTLEEVDAFLADGRPGAYERLVDRLLASPRYGERMAVDWLDAARYADTHGYHIDAGRDMTRWRAWVIDSYNADKPFDQFTVEQVAGDLLPNPTLDQKIASGFNRNHMINFEGGAIPEEYHAAYIIDRVNTTGTVWLGLTVGCTQCHDHKFDPITQKEYFRLFAFFHNVPEKGLDGSKGNAAPLILAPTAAQQAELDRLSSEIAAAEGRFFEPNPTSDRDQAEWERSAASGPSWRNLEVRSAESAGKAPLHTEEDRTIVAGGEPLAVETYSVTLAGDGRDVAALRLEVLPDERSPEKGPGRSVNGNLVLTDVRVESSSDGAPNRPIPIRAASADFSQKDFPPALAIDAKPTTGWAIYPESGKPHEIRFELAEPITGKAAETQVRVVLAFQSPFAGHYPGRFRLSASSVPSPEGKGLPAKVLATLKVEEVKRTEAQKAELRAYYRENVSPEFRPLREEVKALKKSRSELEKQIPTAMVMAEMEKPRDTFIMLRGQYDKKGEKVTPDVPSFLPPLPPDAPKNRLGLARWLVDPGHPLTSRVAVNRLWQTVFGTGLVKTSDDFGSQGEPPSHPDLLDWLAVEFSSPSEGRAWDVKRMVRLMVTSAAYRQSSKVTPEGLAKDPEDRLLARAPRLRLQAEFLRDQALFLGGLLKEKIGGPSVSPYQPAGLWEELMSRADGANWSAQTYTQSHGDDLYRRTMYTFWKRTSPPPSLATFDAPDRETCTVRRARTNTPLQALVLLNDPTYVEASRKFAERIMREGGKTDADRVDFAFRLATSRKARPAEVAVLLRMFESERAKFRADRDRAVKLLGVGESKRDESLDAADLAAWSTVAGVVLNLDETVTKG